MKKRLLIMFLLAIVGVLGLSSFKGYDDIPAHDQDYLYMCMKCGHTHSGQSHPPICFICGGRIWITIGPIYYELEESAMFLYN